MVESLHVIQFSASNRTEELAGMKCAAVDSVVNVSDSCASIHTSPIMLHSVVEYYNYHGYL